MGGEGSRSYTRARQMLDNYVTIWWMEEEGKAEGNGKVRLISSAVTSSPDS